MKKKILLASSFLVAIFAIYAYSATWNIATWTGSAGRRNTIEFTIESAAPGGVAYLRPGTAGAQDLGTSTYYMDEVYARSFNFGVVVDTTTATPDFAGQLVVNSTYEVWIGTSIVGNSWVKVGAQ